jgi:hypothetical protein
MVDFNAGGSTWISLGTLGTRIDLDRQGVRIAEGLRLRGYDFDSDDEGRRNNIVCEGVVIRWREAGHSPKFDWLLAIENVGHESDFRDDRAHWVHQIDWDSVKRIRDEWIQQHPPAGRGYTAADE